MIRNRSLIPLAVAAVLFVFAALIGSAYVSRNMNKAADEHGMSAGRSNDARPNGLQEQQMDKAARGQSTTGSKTEGAVPPASR